MLHQHRCAGRHVSGPGALGHGAQGEGVGVHGRERHGAGVRGRVFPVGFGDECREHGRAWAGGADACAERVGGVAVGICEFWLIYLLDIIGMRRKGKG